jgi:HK97 family phage major capsid protein
MFIPALMFGALLLALFSTMWIGENDVGLKREKLANDFKAIVDAAKKENRSLTEAEDKQLDDLKAEIARLDEAASNAKLAGEQHARREAELRSFAAAQTVRPEIEAMDKSKLFRSITTGGADVGNVDFINDVVKQFEEQSPLFAAHGNVQRRSTGNSFSYTQIAPGTQTASLKVEGNAGSADETCSVVIATTTFGTYSGGIVLISQEMLDDAAADIAQEITALGMAKGILKFDKALVDLLEAAAVVSGDIPETANTTWDLSDLIAMYFSIPMRNRRGIKWIGNATMMGTIVDLMDFEDTAKTALIGLTPENLIVDSNSAADTLIACNPTLALSIGIKQPVRVFRQEVSAGSNFEVQPRLAAGLRDATAVVGREKKGT